MKTIKINAVEVTQSLQNLENTMPLLQDKLTFVRFYLHCDCKDNEPLNVKLAVSVKRSANKTQLLTKLNSTATNAVCNQFSLSDVSDCRLSWDKSLNFILPKNFLCDFQVSADTPVILHFKLVNDKGIEFKLSKQMPENNEIQYISALLPPAFEFKFENVEVNFRTVAYRYTDVETGEVHEPSFAQLRVIRDYIESAFPISKLNWSTITIDTPREFNQLYNVLENSERTDEKIDKVYTFLFQHLLAIRNQDIAFRPYQIQEGGKPKLASPAPRYENNTLYLGVFSDPDNQIVGSAMDSPYVATPNVVAITGTDPYGELGSHEFAHMLGQLHPGIPDEFIHGGFIGQKNQIKNDGFIDNTNESNTETPISQQGYISKNKPTHQLYIGLDTQFHSRHPKLLPHSEYFDLMTYRYPKWVSNYTYRQLFERLYSLRNPTTNCENKNNWTIIGEYNLASKTAKINYLLKSSVCMQNSETATIQEKQDANIDRVAEKFKLSVGYRRLNNSSAETDDNTEKSAKPEAIYLRRSLEFSDNSSFVGVFVHSISTDESLPPASITLLLNDNAVDIFNPWDQSDNIIDYLQKFINKPALSPSDLVTEVLNKLNVNHKVGVGAVDDNPVGKALKLESDTLENIVSLNYCVDKSAFYLSYDWTSLNDKDKNESSKNTPIEDFVDLLRESKIYTVPVTTTIQFKSNIDDEAYADDENLYNWQTVAISNRFKDKFWISPAFTYNLASNNPVEMPPLLTFRSKNTISEFNGSFDELKIRFRVCVTVMGIGLVIYDSLYLKNINDLLSSHSVKVKGYGSTGPKRINYFRPNSTNHENASEHENVKYYYRPNVKVKKPNLKTPRDN